jgi:hypothetical protein
MPWGPTGPHFFICLGWPIILQFPSDQMELTGGYSAARRAVGIEHIPGLPS